jgi:hypothetical protein
MRNSAEEMGSRPWIYKKEGKCSWHKFLLGSSSHYSCLTFLSLKKGASTQWISVKRGKREQYQVKGSNGLLAFKVADSDFQKIRAALETAKQEQGSIVSG